MSTLSFLLSVFGWTFIPDFATKYLLQLVYELHIFPPPQPASATRRKHYAIAYGVVVISYLTYTLVQSSSAMPPNFYEILGVRPDVDENGLKSSFRTFAKKYHPDKAGPGGEALFMYVRDAFEALKDPVIRFAYDRFGPDALAWRHHCRTSREFLKHGFMVSSGYYIATGVALIFWSAIGKPSPVSFWRYIIFTALFAAELSFILSSFPSVQSAVVQPPSQSWNLFPFTTFLGRHLPKSYPIFQSVWPNRVPYQHILFLHQLFVFSSVALTRVIPRITALLSVEYDMRQLEPFELAIWERIYGTLALADREASVILHTILQSVQPTNQNPRESSLALMQPVSPERTRDTLDILTPEMHAMVIEANIKNHLSVSIQTAWKSAVSTYTEKGDVCTFEEELPGTPKSWDGFQPEVAEERRRSPSRSRSGSPTYRRTQEKTHSNSPGRNASAGEF